MIRNRLRLTVFIMLITTCWLCSCHSDPADETVSEEMTAVGEESTDETTAPTETLPETESEREAEAVTGTETESMDPHVLAIAELPAEFKSPTVRNSHCKAAIIEDADVGRVLRISSASISSVGTIPETYLSLESMAAARGTALPSTTAYPYLVLKVRTGELWSRLISFHAGASLQTAKPSSAEGMTRLRFRQTDDWQYICFDLSGYTEDVKTLYLQFEYGAAKSGDSVDIAEFRFVQTEEEAVALCGRDAYELEKPDDVLRILSYNIWVGNGTDTTMRADILRDLIDEYRPDSIGMQEVNRAWLATFEDFVFNESYAGVGEGRDDAYEACLIYYRTDQYELLDSGTFWLSDTPDVKGSKFPDSSYPRICTWIHLRDRVTGYEYMHINTHLDHLGGNTGHAVRSSQIKVLLDFVAGLGDIPIVLTGDFNTIAHNDKGTKYWAYAHITGDPYEDLEGETVTAPFADTRLHAAETVPADRTASMTKYFDENDEAYQPDRLPIDYQFYLPTYWEPLSYNTVIWERDGVPVSDHLALICEYRMLTVDR